MKLRKIIIINVILSLIIPILFFILFHEVSLNLAINLEKNSSIQRYFFFMFLIVISIGINFYLLHIKIKKPAYDELLKDQYFRKGRLIFKLSHHNKKLLHHELKIGNRYICTGCFGVSIGLIFGEILGLFYIFNFNLVLYSFGITLISIGFIMNAISFLKYIKPIFGLIRLLNNACLPAGIWLIIIGIDIYFKSILAIYYCLVIIPFLIFQRIYLAKLDHREELENL